MVFHFLVLRIGNLSKPAWKLNYVSLSRKEVRTLQITLTTHFLLHFTDYFLRAPKHLRSSLLSHGWLGRPTAHPVTDSIQNALSDKNTCVRFIMNINITCKRWVTNHELLKLTRYRPVSPLWRQVPVLCSPGHRLVHF